MESVEVSSSGSFWRIAAAALAAILFFSGVGFAIYESQDLFLASAPLWKWAMIPAVLIPAVVIDLMSHRGHGQISLVNAAMWSVIWALVALGFGLFVAQTGTLPFGDTFSLYTTGWALEVTLALDNLFVMQLIFKSFGLMGKKEQPLQLKILYYGIIGMIIMRVLFLSFGAYFIHLPSVFIGGFELHWPLLLFAAIIAWSVMKMGGDDGDDEVDYSTHWSVKATRWIFPINPSIASGNFFTLKGVTPLFLCVICVEMVDFFFAFDSMPVIIAVVKDPFLMAASNLMACAGLRSLYFVLLAAKNRLWALDTAIKYLLVFIAVKLALAGFGFEIPPLVSLGIVAAFILGGIGYSLMVTNPEPEDEQIEDDLVAVDESTK